MLGILSQQASAATQTIVAASPYPEQQKIGSVLEKQLRQIARRQLA